MAEIKYVYCGEKAPPGYYNMYRHGTDGSYDKYDVETGEWVHDVDAFDAFHGDLTAYTCGEDYALELTKKWTENYKNRGKKEE